MANNHQGSVEHAFKIIDAFSDITKERGINAGIKLQFRQLDTFIHDDFKSSDLKYIKRFRETRLSEKQFSKIVNHIRSCGLATIATPFDNESLSWIYKFDIDIVKVASCSVDDWPLLREICKINKRVVISTAGASFTTLDNVYNLFKSSGRNFAFMHLKRIDEMRARYSDIEIGISTHESPNKKSVVPFAVAKGCRIIEKHVGVVTDKISLNAYSCQVEDIASLIDEVDFIMSACNGEPTSEQVALASLKRGVYFRNDLQPGDRITIDDIYFAMPRTPGQACAADIDAILGFSIDKAVQAKEPMMSKMCKSEAHLKLIEKIRTWTNKFLDTKGIARHPGTMAEISVHNGLENFYGTGAIIIDKINRDYCKKLIIMYPGQAHPTHHHIKKEETFELLHGDCELTLNGKNICLVPGAPVLIPRGAKHSFRSTTGCVIEEISTTHYNGDSVYSDPEICKLKLHERKIVIKL